MKVFEVITEHCEHDSTEILTTRRYITSQKDTLKSVSDHFTIHCQEYELDLKSVKEVLIITEHLDV